MYQQKDGLKGNAGGVPLVSHDMQSCVKVAVEVLDYHRIVVATTQDMTINL